MSAGTRVAIGFVLFALAVLVVLLLYGRESLSHRQPDSPAAVAREMLQADNTVVGMVGAIRTFEPTSVTETTVADSSTALVEARVVGVQAEGADAMTRSFAARRPIDTERADTYADGIASRIAIPRAVELMFGRVDAMMTVGEASLQEWRPSSPRRWSRGMRTSL